MTLKEIYNIVCILAALSVLCPILMCCIKVEAPNKSLWALLFFLILCFISDAVSFVMMDNDNETNINFMFNIHTVLESVLIFFIYYREYNQPNTKYFVLGSFGLFTIYALIEFVWNGGYNEDDSRVITLEAILVIILSGLYFIKIVLDESITKPSNHYFYWINVSFLIYFSAALLIFMNSTFLNNCSPSTACTLYSIHLLVNIFCNVLFSIGIWKVNQIQP